MLEAGSQLFPQAEENHKNNYGRGLDELRKTGIITNGLRALWSRGSLRGITVGSRILPAREKTKARSRS